MIGLFCRTKLSLRELYRNLGYSTDECAFVYHVAKGIIDDDSLTVVGCCEELNGVWEIIPHADYAIFVVDGADASEESVKSDLVHLKSVLKPNAPVVLVTNRSEVSIDGVERIVSGSISRSDLSAANELCKKALKECDNKKMPAVSYDRTICVSSQNRTATLLGHDSQGNSVLTTVALNPLTENALRSIVERPQSALVTTERQQLNGKYSQYAGTLVDGSVEEDRPVPVMCTLSVISPATAADIMKATPQMSYVVEETEEMYETIVRPAVEKIPASETEWLMNIIDPQTGSSAMQEEILFENEHVALLRDTKWPAGNTDINEMYCLLIVKKQHAHIRSIRYLRGSDADWLEESVRACQKYILDTFGVPTSQYLTFFHYYPSFYHLHIHFMHINSCVAATGAVAGRAVFVNDVIQNLRADSDYYKHATLTVRARERTIGMASLIKAGLVSTVSPSSTITSSSS